MTNPVTTTDGAAGGPTAAPGAGRGVRPLELGLACCAVEAAAGRARAHLVAPAGETSPLRVLLVAGTVTDAMAPLVRAEYDAALAEAGPALRVVAFGSCAGSGGPYWDSYAVTKGVDQVLPVDAYVPGCPPRPEAVLDVVEALSAGIGEAS